MVHTLAHKITSLITDDRVEWGQSFDNWHTSDQNYSKYSDVFNYVAFIQSSTFQVHLRLVQDEEKHV